MLRRIIEKYELMKQVHANVYETLADLRANLQNNQTMENITDQILCLREIAKLAEDLRKEATKLQQTAERVICILWVTQKCGEPIQGEYATGTPDVKQAASLPKRSREPEKYAKLMKHIGISDEQIDSGLLSLHWPSFTEYLSTLIAEGKPLPPGIDPDKTYPIYTLRLRKCKEPSLEHEKERYS